MSEGGNNGRQSAAPLLERELLLLCCYDSDSLSEDGLRELIQRHGLTPNNHVSDYKFFLAACCNERVTEGIIRLLLEYFPDAASTADEDGRSPLHRACFNPNVTPNIAQILLDTAPQSVRSVTNNGAMPLHYLCSNRKLDVVSAMKMLNLLLEKYPEAVRHADNKGFLPIHIAACKRSPDFCRLLIEAYPGSERMTNFGGALHLHQACAKNSLATVEYLYRQYPDSINHTTTNGIYPIHAVISGIQLRDNPSTAVDIVQFLLDCDSNQKLLQYQGWSLLRFACRQQYNDSNIKAGIQIVKIIFDAHPASIEDDNIATNIHRYHQQVQEFLNEELAYARQANDHRLMMTPDDNGRLPLHVALQNNVRLGSIKLLVKGNPSAIRSIEDNGALPLHVACEHHDSVSIVGYVLGLARITRDATDSQGNTALHYACRASKYETIALILEKYDAVSVSKRNLQNKLPIELLWESNAVEDRDRVEYMESFFRLLKAYPETLTIACMELQSTSSASAASQNQSGNGKKRKFGDE